LRIHNADDENGFRSGRTREGVDDFVEQSESLRQGVETYRTDGGAGAGDFVARKSKRENYFKYCGVLGEGCE
jgi:hypothetical protein